MRLANLREYSLHPTPPCCKCMTAPFIYCSSIIYYFFPFTPLVTNKLSTPKQIGLIALTSKLAKPIYLSVFLSTLNLHVCRLGYVSSIITTVNSTYTASLTSIRATYITDLFLPTFIAMIIVYYINKIEC